MRFMKVILFILFFNFSLQAQDLTPQQRILTETILGEARGEGEAGMYAIACIVKRRMELKSYPNTAIGVCLEPSQFDYWTQHKRVKWDDQNRANVRRLMKGNNKLVRYAKMLAVNIDKVDLNYINNADHYCALRTHNYWTKKNKPVKIIGNHKFFKLRN